MKSITPEEFLKLPLHKAIERCIEWNNEFNDGQTIKLDDPQECPIDIWVHKNTAQCGKDTVANIKFCPVCGNPCCPDCMNHNVEQLSRVTGYISSVSGWNASKKQELLDRQRTDDMKWG